MSDSNTNKDVDQLLAEIEGLTEPQDDNDKPPPIRALATDHSAAGRGERPELLPPPSPGPDIPDYTLGPVGPGRWLGGEVINGSFYLADGNSNRLRVFAP